MKYDPPTDAELLRQVATGIEKYMLLGIDIPRAAALLRAIAKDNELARAAMES